MVQPKEDVMRVADRLIVALDVPDREKALLWVAQLGLQVRWFKVGLQLFTACGPSLVSEIAGRGNKVFLDLKFHDIPNTVAQAVRSVAGLGAGMINVHAGGGRKMMEAAVKACAESNPAPLLLAVTVLTSMGQEDLGETGVVGTPADQVVRLGALGRVAGVGGFVCSGEEIKAMRKAVGPNLRLVVPGIRPAGADVGDQKRVMTPAEAMAAGADYLVIGRPILEANDPNGEVEHILSQMAEGLAQREGATNG